MRKFYLKTLFLACTMLMSVSSVWAVTYNTTVTGIVGATDNTSGFNVVGSKQMSLAAGDEYVITFVNYNKGASGTDYWENWAFCSNVFNCRADHGASNPYWGSATNVNYTGNSWSDIYSSNTQWLQAYNGVTVTLSVSRNAAGTGITISHTTTTNAVDAIASQTYAGTFTATVGAETAINFYLTVENAHLNITKVIHTDASGNSTYSYNASESAYVDSSNGATNYNGSSVSQLQINNTQYRNWSSGSDGSVKFNSGGKAALYKFDLSEIKTLSNITTISFTVAGISSDASTATSPVWLLGYNPEWSASSITYNTGFTNNGNAETLTGTISGKGSFQPLDDTGTFSINGSNSGYTTMTANAKTYVESAITADKDYVSFGLAVNLGRVAYLNVGADLTISCSASVVYTATFTETNSLSPNITIYSDAGRSEVVSNGALTDGTTYYYTAVLAGYNDYLGSFTVNGTEPTVNFTMTAKTRYTFTINAVDAGSNVIKAIYTDADSYEGKVHTILYPKYLTGTGNIVTYSKDNNTYGESKTAQAQNETYTVSYTAYNGVAWYVEVEDVVSGTGYDSWNCSNGRAVRGFTDARNIVTVPATGTYDVIYAICNNNVNNELSCTLSKNSDEIFTTEGLQYVSINYIRTTGIITNNNVSLESGDVLKLAPSSTNGIVDYMLVELKSVPATIGSTGWTTFASAHPLDLSNMTASTGDVTAYYASAVNNGSVTMTSTESSAVAAGEGLMLKGTAGATITIPVVASGTAIEGNKLVGCTTSTVLTANSNYYVLVNNSGTAEFQCLDTNGATIPAGKAYLNVPSAGANLRISFDADETTGINIVECSESTTGIYNLSGQRVMNPTKGLYIMNGKKVYIK